MRNLILTAIAVFSFFVFFDGSPASAQMVCGWVGRSSPCQQRNYHHHRQPHMHRSYVHRTPMFVPRSGPCGYDPCSGGLHARPTRELYEPAPVASVEYGISYTGKSCIRAEGVVGREGFGPGGQIGCWKF